MIERWPVNPSNVSRIARGVLTDRGDGTPHNGVDIMVPAGTQVISPVNGVVIRVVDGRNDASESRKRAGLWVDIEEKAFKNSDKRIHRFLHLGSASVKDGQRVAVGDLIGVVANAHESGLGDEPHLHYEQRKVDKKDAYGEAIDPRFDMADAVARHAWENIPKIAHIVGTYRYDMRSIKVSEAVKKVWNEKDPGKRMELAHDADELSKSEYSKSFWESYKDDAKYSTEQVVGKGKEALKEAGKEVIGGIGSWWNDLSFGWKAGIIGTGVVGTGLVIKSFWPSHHSN